MSKQDHSCSRLGTVARCAVLGVAVCSAPNTASGAMIVGFANDWPETAGTMYSFNAGTGVATAIRPHFGIALSSGPSANTILYSSAVNTYEYNVITERMTLYACLEQMCLGLGDHALDSRTGTVYALWSPYPSADEPQPPDDEGPTLFRMADSIWPPPFAGSRRVEYGPVGLLGVNGITVIEYVSGVGLLGTDGSALYRINSATGQATLFTELSNPHPDAIGGLRINGLAYDPETRRLLASTGPQFDPFGDRVAQLYIINIDAADAAFGSVTWLNDAPLGLTGIVTVTPVPEPSSIVLLAAGLGAGICVRMRQRRRSRRDATAAAG